MRCFWCLRAGTYEHCQHGEPPRGCRVHGKWTDLNLVARGKRAVVKCAHYGTAFVVLYADPISDNKEHSSYTIQFGMPGVGSEIYTIPPRQHACPHHAFDELVADMRSGARPGHNRVPSPQTETTTPGQELPTENQR